MGTGARARVPLDFQLFNFSSHFRAAQTSIGLLIRIRLDVVAYQKEIVTVYCMNFTIFLCVTFELLVRER